MSLSDLVAVTFSLTNPGVTQAGFGVPLLTSFSATWPERVRYYDDIDSVADDFAANTPEYMAAEVMFSQSTGLSRLGIGRCANVPTQRWAVGTYQAVVAGVYTLTITGPDTGETWVDQEVSYTAEASVAWAITTAYVEGDVVTNDSGKLYVCITGGTSAGATGPTGTAADITDGTVHWMYAGTGSTGVTSNDVILYNLKLLVDALILPVLDVATSMQGSAGSRTLRIVANTAGDFFGLEIGDPDYLEIEQDHADPGIAADLTAIKRASASWYGLVTTFNSSALVTAAAAWVEANKKLYVVASQDTEIITVETTTATDIFQDLADAAYARTAPIYHPANDEFADAASIARWFPIDPGADDWRLKTLAGVTVKEYSSTHETNLLAKFANWYADLAGTNVVQGSGKVSADEYIDVVRFRDWYEARLQERCANAMIQSEKIPFTDEGVAVFENIIKALNDEGIEVGGIAKSPKPTIIVPQVADVTTADKQARWLRGVKSTWTLAGAIHKISITVTASP